MKRSPPTKHDTEKPSRQNPKNMTLNLKHHELILLSTTFASCSCSRQDRLSTSTHRSLPAVALEQKIFTDSWDSVFSLEASRTDVLTVLSRSPLSVKTFRRAASDSSNTQKRNARHKFALGTPLQIRSIPARPRLTPALCQQLLKALGGRKYVFKKTPDGAMILRW